MTSIRTIWAGGAIGMVMLGTAGWLNQGVSTPSVNREVQPATAGVVSPHDWKTPEAGPMSSADAGVEPNDGAELSIDTTTDSASIVCCAAGGLCSAYVGGCPGGTHQTMCPCPI